MHRKWWTLLAVCVATFMLLLDITVVNVALPDIQSDLRADLTGLQWVVDAYALTLAALTLTAGTLADRFGRRRIFVIGVGVFTFASLLCGLSTSPTFLHLARGLQGVGGAAMFATSLALIAQEFDGPERGTAIAAWGATIGGAVAIGPLVGGALTEGLGWEWIFFVNVPIGIATVLLAESQAGESHDPGAKRLDWAGLVTFSGALFALNFGLLRGNAEGWSSAVIVGALVAAAVLLVVFVAAEIHQDHAMFDLALFRKPAFTGVSIGAFAIGAGMFAMFLYITIYIQSILGYSPLQAGLRFLPLTLLAFLVPAITRNLVSRVPARVPLGTGLFLVGLGLLLQHGVDVDSEWTALLAGFIVCGTGIGLSNPSIASTALGVVAPARSGMASGINNTFRVSGVATGVAALGAIFQSRIDSKLSELLPHAPAGLADAVASSGTQQVAANAPPGQSGRIVEAARIAFVDSFNEILLVGAVILFAGSLAVWALVRQRDFVAGPGQ
ncbi:MAG: MFS transporter [Solirubrobacterales bacterium]